MPPPAPVATTFFKGSSKLVDLGIYGRSAPAAAAAPRSDFDLVTDFVEKSMEDWEKVASLRQDGVRTPQALQTFWIKNKDNHPLIFQGHRQFSGVCHSMGLEQDFSMFSWVYSPLRKSLRTDMVEMMMFLVVNKDSINWDNVPVLKKEEAAERKPKTIRRVIDQLFNPNIVGECSDSCEEPEQEDEGMD